MQSVVAWRAARSEQGLAAVSAVPVGLAGDGLALRSAGAPIDKSWGDLLQELTDARAAWQQNPLARRIVGLTTSYTVGHGITLQSPYRPLQRFIDEFWQHNHMEERIDEWSDELARSGELFPVLFTDALSGMSAVRTVPACLIEAVDYDADDYERELRYRECTPIGAAEKWWRSPQVGGDNGDVRIGGPVMLHFAVNRPIGAVRGERTWRRSCRGCGATTVGWRIACA